MELDSVMILTWIFLSIVVGIYGNKKCIGWDAFLYSLFLSPLVGFIYVKVYEFPDQSTFTKSQAEAMKKALQIYKNNNKHKDRVFLKQVNQENAITFDELICELTKWLENNPKPRVSDNAYGNQAYLHFTFKNDMYAINADTTSNGINSYLSKYRNGNEILIIPSNGNRKKMTCGNQNITGLYIYEVN